MKIYSKYGEVESLKLMLPRNEDERKRKRNCAFVKYYEGAYLSKEELAEKFLYGQKMRICWTEGIAQMVRAAGYMADFNKVSGD